MPATGCEASGTSLGQSALGMDGARAPEPMEVNACFTADVSGALGPAKTSRNADGNLAANSGAAAGHWTIALAIASHMRAGYSASPSVTVEALLSFQDPFQ